MYVREVRRTINNCFSSSLFGGRGEGGREGDAGLCRYVGVITHGPIIRSRICAPSLSPHILYVSYKIRTKELASKWLNTLYRLLINNRVPRRKVESLVILLSVITCAFVT